MSLTYGFYNSLNGDRKYNADQLSAIFNNLITDGVFMNVGERLMVTKGIGMGVIVGTGRAWFNSKWTYNDARMPINIDKSESVLNRIDIVALEVNHDNAVRKNSIKIIKGVPATNPTPKTLIRNDVVNQYALAHVFVGKGVTEIRVADITNKVGTSNTPFVTGVLETMNIDSLIAQWSDDWSIWTEIRKSEFEIWFEGLETTLKGDVAANLYLQMDQVFTSVSNGKEAIATAITDKGVATHKEDTFQIMANNITSIQTKSILSGNAVASQVLSGKTFYSDSETKQTGTMPNRGNASGTITTQGGSINITPGYYTGGSINASFSNLLAGNIRSGVTVGGVRGSLIIPYHSGTTFNANGRFSVSGLKFKPKIIYGYRNESGSSDKKHIETFYIEKFDSNAFFYHRVADEITVIRRIPFGTNVGVTDSGFKVELTGGGTLIWEVYG